jgi:hypothetical protein
VDKALDYRPKGTGFDPRLDHKRRSTWATNSFSMWDNKDLMIGLIHIKHTSIRIIYSKPDDSVMKFHIKVTQNSMCISPCKLHEQSPNAPKDKIAQRLCSTEHGTIQTWATSRLLEKYLVV